MRCAGPVLSINDMKEKKIRLEEELQQLEMDAEENQG